MRQLLFWILLIPVIAFGQQVRPPYIIKIAPLNLINFYQQSVDLHADIPLSSRWGIDMGTGIIFHSAVFSRFKEESFLGLKLQPAIKYYMERSERHNSYLSVVFKYISVNNDRYASASRQGNQYLEWLLHRKKLVTYGAALRLGGQYYLGTQKRLILEPYVGLGWRQLHVTEGNLPPDAGSIRDTEALIFERRPGIYTTADFMMGFYLGWRIGGSKS